MHILAGHFTTDRIDIGMMFYVRLFVVLSFFSTVEGFGFADEVTLKNNLLNSYSRSVAPGEDKSQPLTIYVEFYWISLKEFDESDSKIAITGVFNLKWTDSRLTWNGNLFNGLQATTFLQSEIWVPYLVNLNSYSSMKALGNKEMSLKVDYNGSVTWLPPDLFESMCDADVTYYPFDSQTCIVKFYVPGYYPDTLVFHTTSNTLDSKIYQESGTWQILSNEFYSQVNEYSMQELRIQINMKRRSVYYIVGLILPVLIMSLLQITVFVLPVESGERVGFAITVMLAIAVFLTIVQDNLPESSQPNVSYLTYKLLADLIIGAILIVLVVISLRFIHPDRDDKVTPFADKFTRIFYPPVNCRKSSKIAEADNEKVCNKENMDDHTSEEVSWPKVGLAFDRFSIILLSIFLFVNNVVYFGLCIPS